MQHEIPATCMPAANIQDSFFSIAQQTRQPVTVWLLNRVKISGNVRSFDKYSVLIEAGGKEQLIFKHSITSVAVAEGHGCQPLPAMPSKRSA